MNILAPELVQLVCDNCSLRGVIRLSQVNRRFNQCVAPMIDVHLRRISSTAYTQSYLDQNQYYSQFNEKFEIEDTNKHVRYLLNGDKLLFHYNVSKTDNWDNCITRYKLVIANKSGYHIVVFRPLRDHDVNSDNEDLYYHAIRTQNVKVYDSTTTYETLFELMDAVWRQLNDKKYYKFVQTLLRLPYPLPPKTTQYYMVQYQNCSLKLDSDIDIQYITEANYRNICIDDKRNKTWIFWAAQGRNIYIKTRCLTSEQLDLAKLNIQFNGLTNVHFDCDAYYDYVVTDNREFALACCNMPSQPDITGPDFVVPKNSGYIKIHAHYNKYQHIFKCVLEDAAKQMDPFTLHHIFTTNGYELTTEVFESAALNCIDSSLPEFVKKHKYYSDKIVLRCCYILRHRKQVAQEFYNTAIQHYNSDKKFWVKMKAEYKTSVNV